MDDGAEVSFQFLGERLPHLVRCSAGRPLILDVQQCLLGAQGGNEVASDVCWAGLINEVEDRPAWVLAW